MSNGPDQESRFGEAGDALHRKCLDQVDLIKALRDRIVGVTVARTAENTLAPLDEIDRKLDVAINASELLQNVHPDDKVREASEICHQEVAKLASALGLDRALYDAVGQAEAQLKPTDPVEQRFIKHNLRDFKRSGVDLEH